MSEWVTKPLGEIVTFQKGRKVETSPNPLDGYREYLGAGKLSNSFDGYASTFLAVIAEESDVLMLWDGERSGLCRTELSGVVSSTVSKLTPTDSIDGLLLYYLLLQRYGWIQHRRTGTGVPHVPKDLGRILHLSYSRDKDEQKKIARILQTIDRAIEKTEALIDKYQQIKAGLMHDLFTRGIGPDGQLRPHREKAPELYQETPIGWIPKEWRHNYLGRLCDVSSGGTPARTNKKYWGGAIPWIKTGEVKYNLITSSEEYITDEGLKGSSAKIFPGGTVVMAIYGEGNTRGRVAVLGVDCATNQACVGFSFSHQIQSRYMYHFFQHKYQELRDLSNDGSQKNLSSSLLKKFPVSFPVNLDEQNDIVSKLAHLDALLEQEKNYCIKLQKEKSGLMHDLLTGKVPVEVEPEDAPEAAHV